MKQEKMQFDDLSVMGGIFAVSSRRMAARLPAGEQPLCIAPGIALAGVFGFECRKSGVGKYNEAAVGIFLSSRPKIFPGAFETILSAVTGKSAMRLIEIPVSGKRAHKAGVDAFGWPKFAAEVSFREAAGRRICTVRNVKSHELLFELDTAKMPTGGLLSKNSIRHLIKIPAGGNKRSGAYLDMTFKKWGFSFLIPDMQLRWGRDTKIMTLKNAGWSIPLLTLYAPSACAELTRENKSGLRKSARKNPRRKS